MSKERITVIYNGQKYFLRPKQTTVQNLCGLYGIPESTRLFLVDTEGNVEFDENGSFPSLSCEVSYTLRKPNGLCSFPGNPILPTTDLRGVPSGCYNFYIADKFLRLWLDNDTDGGGWVLIHKTDRSSSNDVTDDGHNISGLESVQLDTVSILPRAIIAQMGSTFRVQSCPPYNYKLFWKGKAYYTTDKHPEKPAEEIIQNISSKYCWEESWKVPCEGHTKTGSSWGTSPHHGFTMWGPAGAHFCASRWCNGPDPGIHFNHAPVDNTRPWGGEGQRGLRLSGMAWVKWGSFEGSYL